MGQRRNAVPHRRGQAIPEEAVEIHGVSGSADREQMRPSIRFGDDAFGIHDYAAHYEASNIIVVDMLPI